MNKAASLPTLPPTPSLLLRNPNVRVTSSYAELCGTECSQLFSLVYKHWAIQYKPSLEIKVFMISLQRCLGAKRVPELVPLRSDDMTSS